MQDNPENAVPTTQTKPAAERRRRRADATAPAETSQPAQTAPSAPASATDGAGTSGTAGKPASPVAERKPETAAPATTSSPASAPVPGDGMAASLQAGSTALKTQTNALATYVTLATMWSQHWHTLLGASLRLQQQLAEQVVSNAGQLGRVTDLFCRNDEEDR